MVKRNLTGAHYGLNTWLQQRITAVIMLILAIVFIIFVGFIASNVNSSITSWQNVFHCTFVKFFAQIFFVSVVLHAWIGIRDIWMDYVQCAYAKLMLHVLTLLWLLGSLVYSIKVIWL